SWSTAVIPGASPAVHIRPKPSVTCIVTMKMPQCARTTRLRSRSPRLQGVLTQIGLALAGRAGSRLASVIGVAAGRDTLLRLVKAVPDPPKTPITVLGVDDFAFRRGRHYGTVLIDTDSHRPVDMFDGRDGDSLAEWLRQHPEIEVICRDRAGGYGEGARSGAPQAVQVADRFHLWQNLGQAVEKTVNAYRSRLVAPAPPPADDTMPAEVQPLPEKKIVTRLREHHGAVHELAAQGLNKSAIGRKLGLHQATVRQYLNAASVAELTAVTEQRAHLVDAPVELTPDQSRRFDPLGGCQSRLARFSLARSSRRWRVR
ncbi:transposase, partial [Micromonospora sp. NPDC050795]|uniref:transposase n=1 Tax=Micromonospora sp. NPDC050795 TaxID=3364282 RepID=UPI0037998256